MSTREPAARGTAKEADETEKIAEREQRENQPDRMQSDAFADKLRRQHIAFEKLAEQNECRRQSRCGSSPEQIAPKQRPTTR